MREDSYSVVVQGTGLCSCGVLQQGVRKGTGEERSVDAGGGGGGQTHTPAGTASNFLHRLLPSWSTPVITSCQVIHRCTVIQLPLQVSCCIYYLFVNVCIASEAPEH